MYRTKLRWIAPALVLALGVAGCDDSTTPETPETSVTVLLTDNPGVEAVWVQVLEIYFQGDDEVLDPPLVAPGWINLLDYKDDYFELVNGADMPEGNYQLRLLLGESALLVEELADGSFAYFQMGDPWAVDPSLSDGGGPANPGADVGVLHCPSCTQSGLKIIPIEEAISIEGDEETLVVDFDVAESFGKEAGNSGTWVMRPVIRQVVEETLTEGTQGG
jgi:hypothetical protein